MNTLEQSIAEWRKAVMAARKNLGPETLAELENHLRETVDELVRSGVAESEAFQRALKQLGTPEMVASEFGKLTPGTWLPVKVMTGAGAVASLLLTCFLFGHGSRGGTLLTTHVLAVTLGYAATFLLGMLGICFVCQRCRADFPARRVEFATRAGLGFAWVAAGLIAIGIVLGMVWSEKMWGRWWGWDAREVATLCVLAWLLGFIAACRFRWVTPQRLLVWGALSGSVAGICWMGPVLQTMPLHSYGMANPLPALLMAAVMGNVVIFLVGLAPAGWLRWRKA